MNFRIILLSFLFLISVSSCIVYHPQTVDVPLIREKNDLRVDAGISLIPSEHATISYGLTDKIAIQGFGSIGVDDRYYFQGATGWYKSLGNRRVREFYGGFGYGQGSAFKDAFSGSLYGNYQLYFVQYNYGKVANETSNFEIGFGVKTGYLHSNLTDKNYCDLPCQTETYDKYSDSSILLEPTGMLRFGGEKLRVSVKLGSCVMYKFTNREHRIPYSYFNFGLGLNYRL